MKPDPAVQGEAGSSGAAIVAGGRILGLDAVRGIAVLLVIGFHATFRFAEGRSDPMAKFLGNVGWIGVDMFFALSGFLIAGILMRQPEASRAAVADFFRRRFYRIVPIFLVAIGVYFCASIALSHEPENLRRLWMSALLLNGWVIPFLGVDNVPYTIAWSLSVEEFAYVALGAAALLSRRTIVRVVAAFVAVALAVRWMTLYTGWTEPALLYYFVPARLDAIAFGALGALGAFRVFTRSRYSAWFGAAAVIALMIGFQWLRPGGWLLPAAGYSLFGLAAAIWVAQLATARMGEPWAITRVLAAIGEVSYFIYLFHMFALDAVRLASASLMGAALPYWPGLLLSTLLVYVVARLSWRWFETPLMERGRRRPHAVTAANSVHGTQR